MNVNSIVRNIAALLCIGIFTICNGQTTKKNDLTHKKIVKKKVQQSEPAEIIEEDKVTIYEIERTARNDTIFEFFNVTERAMFEGGDEGLQQFIAENIKYPPKALEKDKQGTVNIMFIITKDGKVADVTILGKPIGHGLDQEAIRVIKLTSGMWKPATHKGKTVAMRFRIPIAFQIY
ncbi:MAG: hypothetical protein RLZZ337_1229 [Bacteroidota bacterium]|jgi:TonB family protein